MRTSRSPDCWPGETSSRVDRSGASANNPIERTRAHTDWNKSQAAAILHIERSTLDRKIKAYNLSG
jgi:transcriptional regulator of acetoin/glycerol metabolism